MFNYSDYAAWQFFVGSTTNAGEPITSEVPAFIANKRFGHKSTWQPYSPRSEETKMWLWGRWVARCHQLISHFRYEDKSNNKYVCNLTTTACVEHTTLSP